MAEQGLDRGWHRTADDYRAANEASLGALAKVQAERDRYREALERIADRTPGRFMGEVRKIAREALDA